MDSSTSETPVLNGRRNQTQGGHCNPEGKRPTYSESKQKPNLKSYSDRTQMSSETEITGEAEREFKKLRRKENNRESARRSRQRKQADCEAVLKTVSDLQERNSHLQSLNEALLAQVEELKAKLDKRSPARTVSPGSMTVSGAFRPVVPSSKQPFSLGSRLSNGTFNSELPDSQGCKLFIGSRLIKPIPRLPYP